MSASRQRYYIQIDDLSLARGEDPALSFNGATVAGLVEQVTAALRENALYEQWRQMQEDPDEVDPVMGLLDPRAEVSAETARSRVDVIIHSDLPHSLIKHRLHLLIGHHWRLFDVKTDK